MTGPEQGEVLEMDLGELEISRRVLRAQLAGMALQGILAGAPRLGGEHGDAAGQPKMPYGAAAGDAVRYADTLLELLEISE